MASELRFVRQKKCRACLSAAHIVKEKLPSLGL